MIPKIFLIRTCFIETEEVNAFSCRDQDAEYVPGDDLSSSDISDIEN